ncbi:hypothetical protein [Segatella bryantii]|uniref:hypothetical protein n=1 Tax=Segatella bryantii TaxID=77095 RepID=UPI00241D187B|nr:hypothetical protein [Segatella bryantii]
MKDIGSIFPLYAVDFLDSVEDNSNNINYNQINFSLCREAILAIAKENDNSNKIVLLPAYTCQTVIDPFLQEGWQCYFYNISSKLRIDTVDLKKIAYKKKPAIVLVHPFYGCDLNEIEISTLIELKSTGCILVEDITQCIYSQSATDIFNYIVGSYRKWCQVPDGGFLRGQNLSHIEHPKNENIPFVQKQMDAMYLRGVYFQYEDENIKKISIRINKEAVSNISQHITIHKMAQFSMKKWIENSHEDTHKKRLVNYKYLYDHIRPSAKIQSVCSNIQDLTTYPLYYPIYTQNRTELQKKLASEHIYAPILWPIKTKAVIINENIKKIYDTILMIPIDQRYDLTDMKKIVDILNK